VYRKIDIGKLDWFAEFSQNTNYCSPKFLQQPHIPTYV